MPPTWWERLVADQVDRVRLRTSVRRYVVDALDALGHAPLRSETGHAVRTLVIGPDPIRLLLFGGGTAVGYGVTTRDEALDGALARIVAARTGRGVIVENRSQAHLAVTEAAASLGGAGAHTFHAVVWAPSFADGTRRLSARSWRRAIIAMVGAIRSERPVPIVLTELAVPLGNHPAAIIGRPWLARINRVVGQVAAQHDGVVAVATQPFVAKAVGVPVVDAGHYEAGAALVADGLAELLGLPPGAGGASARGPVPALRS